jgi:hypothetical protein
MELRNSRMREGGTARDAVLKHPSDEKSGTIALAGDV